MITIQKILSDKKKYLDLLLLADEQESMIDTYLEQGDMFALFDDDLKTICVAVDNHDGTCEIKNLATKPMYQNQGYGKKMISFIGQYYQGACHTLWVGTGDSPLTIPFYEKCGFTRSHRVKNFFVDHYDHPIIENGCRLTDMVYLKKRI